jgi:AcrR family transcriptional regulator
VTDRGPLRLHRTPPLLPRGFVVEHQKRRAAVAFAELCRERGPWAVTVAMVCETAHMARGTFYNHFSGIAGCSAYTGIDSFERTFGSLLAKPEENDAADRLQSSLATLFTDLASQPVLAEYCLVHSLCFPGEVGKSPYEMAVGAVESPIAAFFSATASSAKGRRRRLSPLRSEFLARAILAQAAMRLRHGESQQLLGLEEDWTRLIATYRPAAGLPGGPVPSNT